jgi:hypothetical protein
MDLTNCSKPGSARLPQPRERSECLFFACQLFGAGVCTLGPDSWLRAFSRSLRFLVGSLLDSNKPVVLAVVAFGIYNFFDTHLSCLGQISLQSIRLSA